MTKRPRGALSVLHGSQGFTRVDDLWLPETPFLMPITVNQAVEAPVGVVSLPGLLDRSEGQLLQRNIGQIGQRNGVTTGKIDVFATPRNPQNSWAAQYRFPASHEVTFELLMRAADAACRLLTAEQPGLPIVLCGHSISGMAAAALYRLYKDNGLRPPFSALALIAPSIGEVAKVWHRFHGSHEDGWIKRHPLTHSYNAEGRRISAELLDARLRNSDLDALSIEIPTLVMVGQDDEIRLPVMRFFDLIPAADKILRVVQGDHNLEHSQTDDGTCEKAVTQLTHWFLDVPKLLQVTPGRSASPAEHALAFSL